MSRQFFSIKFVVSVCLLLSASAFCAPQEISEDFAPIEWCFQDTPAPETYWTPWLPLVHQEVLRMRMGFRVSTGSICTKCPVRLTFTYDDDNAESGKDLPIKVKAEMLPTDNSFESSFGINVPNKLQIGFFGISGLPDFLPWYDLPWDFWELLGYVPIPELGGVDIPGTLESLKNNIGVNMSSEDALPLGSTESYHDARDLFSFSLEDLAGEYKDDIAPEIFNKLSDELGSDGMDELLTIIRLTKNVNNDQAVEFLTDLCGDAVDKIAGFGTLAASGDPYFSVEGITLRVTARCFIPGGKGSGVWTLYFTESGQEQTINFRDITPFIEDGDKLEIVIDEIMYEFRLRQGMNAQLGISLATVNLDNTEKVVSYVQSAKKYTASDFKLEIPLSPSDSLIQGLRAHPGCVSASINWASPTMPVKGTVKAYDSRDRLVKTVTESTFKNAHNVIVTDLQENTDYHFEVSCVDASGQSSPVMTTQAKTKENCEPREDLLSIAATNKYEAFELTNPTVTAGTDSISFSWTTNTPGSTEALISPSPDLSANYVACVKKEDGTVVQGWVTRDGERKIEKSHQMMVTELEPGTLYYYNIKSWRFDNDDPTANPTFAVGKVGQISTQALPPTPTVKVKAVFGGQPVPEIPIVALRNGDPSFRLAVNTESTGFTPVMTLPNSCSYTFSVKNHAYYQDVTSSNLYLSNTAQGPQSDIILQLTARPSPGGYVYDSQGNPISGAAVKIVGKSSYQTTTNAAGHYTFEGFSFKGAVTVEISKANYVTKRVNGEVAEHGLVKQFSADNCILPSALAKLNLTVKNNSGTPINNANVIIKEGNTKIGATLKTNAQGKVTFSNNFNDNNANYHNLKIEVQPAAGSGVAGVITEMSIVGGSEQDLEINCPQDTQGPVIANLVITQQDETKALVSFDSSEDGTYKVVYKEPGSNTERSTSLLSLAIADNKFFGRQSLNFDKTGTYKIKVKVTDRNGNETQTDWTDLVFYTGTFRFTSPGTTTNSITFNWSRPWANEAEFGKYVIAIEYPARTIDITDRLAKSYTLTGLNSNQLICGTFKVLSKSGEELYSFNEGGGSTPNRFSISTQGTAPHLSLFTARPNPAGTNQTIHTEAQLADPDHLIQKIKLTAVLVVDKYSTQPAPVMNYERDIQPEDSWVSRDFSINSAGSYKLTIIGLDYRNEEVLNQSIDLEVSAALDLRAPQFTLQVPASANAGEPVQGGLIKLASIGKDAEELTFDINWGDGKTPERITIDFTKSMGGLTRVNQLVPGSKDEYIEVFTGDVSMGERTYSTAGNYKITVTATSKWDKDIIPPSSVEANIQIDAVPVTATLTRDMSKRDDPGQEFHIIIVQGTYPIKKWTLDYGDGSKASSGSGAVDKYMPYGYDKNGTYNVELKATDSKNNEVKANLSVSIVVPERIVEDTQPTQGEDDKLKKLQDDGAALTSGTTLKKTTTTTTTTKSTTTNTQASPGGDLSIDEVKLPDSIIAGNEADITVSVKNDSDVELDEVTVTFYVGSKKIEDRKISVKAQQTQQEVFKYTPEKALKTSFRTKLTTPTGFKDSNTRNNTVVTPVEIIAGETDKKIEESPDETAQEETKSEESTADKEQVPTGDLALVEMTFGKEAAVEKPMTITVTVKNDSEFSVEDIGVTLFAGAKKVGDEKVSLGSKETKKIEFSYTPVKQGALAFRAKIARPKGFKETVVKNDTITEKVTVE